MCLDDSGPKSSLRKFFQSMEPKDFVLSGLQSIGAIITPKTADSYLSELNKNKN